MKTKFIEACDGTAFNWGKFVVGRFTKEEWNRPSSLPEFAPGASTKRHLLDVLGWDACHVLVLDLATGEGALFRPGGSARADLNKHKIWVCPMYEPFLEWLYQQALADLDALPPFVSLGGVATAMQGYRRTGDIPDTMRPEYDLSKAQRRYTLPVMPVTGFMRLPQVLNVLPIGKSSWWDGVKSGKYPQPVKLGPRTTAWRAEDIHALIETFNKAGAKPRR